MHNEKILIAIVDDDDFVREAIKRLIQSTGLTAEAFASGEDFLHSSRVDDIGCLLADINMPGMSGLELHSELAALGKRIPTVLITGNPKDSVRAQALAAGVTGFLAKPFKEKDLLDCVRAALGNEDHGGENGIL